DVLDHALDALARERLAVDLESGAVRLRLAQELTRRVERGLARALRTANTRDLGLVLRAAPVVEDLAVDDDVDAVRAQVVRMRDRKAWRHRRPLEAELAASAKSELQLV